MDAGSLLGWLFALVGAFVGLAGWLTGREKRTSNMAEWRGSVNSKLDAIIAQQACLTDHEKRITIVERDLKTSFSRIDDTRQRLERAEVKLHA